MEKKWELKKINKKNKHYFPELEPTTEQILTEKGFKSEQELEAFFIPDYNGNLHDPFLLNDMKKAVQRILKAQKNKEKICIFGDYDADGVTSSVLLATFLTDELKLDNFCYIPNREDEGYGMNQTAIDFIQKEGATLIITVDCGITNLEEVDYANEKNIDVIISDHHNVIGKVPKALAVIDPKNPNEKKYPFRELAGVGVAFKILQAIAIEDKNINEEKLKWYLDLVAIGTVADCVPLINENRTLVKFGLMVLSKTQRVGLRQLFQVGRIKIGESELPTADQIGYQIAPRINAAGRMNHASIAYKLLLEKDEAKANELAQEIEDQNKQRQKVTADILKKVKAEINALAEIPKVIIKSSSQWKIGIVGLSAGRLAQEFARPVILLQEKGPVYRGSGRSIPGFSLVNALQHQEKLLKKYGGHDQAAGLTLLKENFEEFKKDFLAEAEKKLTKKIVKTTSVDACLKLREVNKKLCEELLMLEPFGKGNELPILMLRNLKLIDKKLLGKEDKHLKLWVGTDDCTEIFEAIGFGLGADSQDLKIGQQIDLLFNLEQNNWNGNKTLQLKIIDYRKSK